MIAAAGTPALWYLTRGTGLVTLVLLTASVVLGIVQVQRWTPARTPRFAVVTLHRAVSLLVVALLGVHVLTAVLDSFAPIRLLDAVLPFAGAYRPLWLGLGALALDLLVAVTLTSLVRRRLGLRVWRAVHWLAYACWPVALVHGWGTGSDARTGWMLAVTLGCAGAVLAAGAWRLAGARPAWRPMRGVVAGGCLLLSLVAATWLAQGPLAGGWARRAGTPAALLASATTRPATGRPHREPARSSLVRRFSARVHGTVRKGLAANGTAVVDLRLRLTGGAHGVLRIRLAGSPSAGGGVLMRRSAVTLGPASAPTELAGRIVSLRGTSLEALVGSSAGPALRLRVDLSLSTGTASGTVSSRPVAAASR